ncbi:MAG: RDD family protein [bacterium]
MGDELTPPRRPDSRGRPLLGRLIGAGTRTGIRGAGRVAEATGIDEAVEEAASVAVVRALESPAAERALAQALESAAVERSLNQVIDSAMIDRVWDRLLASDEVQKLVERVAQAPEVRQAIASQGVGLIDDVGAQIAKAARRLDDIFERFLRRLRRMSRREARSEQAGLASRAAAAAVDALVLDVLLLAATALIAAAVDFLFGTNAEVSVEAVLVGTVFWFLSVGTYLVCFWSLAGETPGMRFLDIRIEGPDGRRIGLRRAWRRLVGLLFSILPLGLGLFASAWDERRRTWADRRAGTEVVYLAPRNEAPWSAQRSASRLRSPGR